MEEIHHRQAFPARSFNIYKVNDSSDLFKERKGTNEGINEGKIKLIILN
jgi:hypothetical protein